MSLKHSVIYNTLVQFAGRFGASALGFVVTLLIARTYGAGVYGAYAKAYTLSAFFYLFIDFGLNAVYIRRHKDDVSFFSLLSVLRSLLFILSSGAIFVFLALFGSTLFKGTDLSLALLFVITILFYGYFISFNAIFQIKGRYDLSVLANIVGGVASLVLVWFSLKSGIEATTAAVVAGYGLTVLLAFYLARRIAKFDFFSIARAPVEKLGSFFVEAAPLGLMLFVNTMYFRADVFVIGFFKGNAEVGVYQLAYKFFEFPLSFATFFANAIFPHYVKLYDEDKKRFYSLFRRAGMLLSIVAIIFTIGAVLFAPLLSLVKADYKASAPALQILAWSYPIFFLTSPLSWLLFIQKKEIYLLGVYMAAMILSIALNIVFVPMFGFRASAVITILSELFVLLLLLIILKKHTNHAQHSQAVHRRGK